MFTKKTKIKVFEDWKDDLIWCPSQCYKKITFGKKRFVLYLRWRHNDPWTATLIECAPNKDFDLFDEKTNWIELKVPFFKDKELEKVKKEAEKLAFEIIKSKR